MNAITLCMIVKDEEKNLDLCLHSIAGYVDEIIVVDTGSADKTREIALRYTDKVYDYTWINDFSAARNFSVGKASNELILVLDGDEIVEDIDIDKIKALIARNPKGIGRLLCVSEFRRGGNLYRSSDKISRLFSKKYYHYQGRIHEQIVSRTKEGEETYNIPLKLRHSGYDGDLLTRRKKTERNIDLLKKAMEISPDDPYLMYQLGKSYYMEEDYTNACELFGQALYFDLDPQLEYVQDMVESYGYSLINSEQYEASLQLLNIYDEFGHSADFIFLIALILMNNGRFEQAILEFSKAAAYPEAKMEGVNGYLSYYNIGVIYECLGDKKNASSYYLKCGNYDAARQRLKDIQS